MGEQNGSTAVQAPELLDPTSGELIDLTSIDAMADAYERLGAFRNELSTILDLLRARFAEADKTADPDKKIRRIRGNVRTVRLELPEVSFDQNLLRQIVAKWPHSAEGLVIPANYRVAAVGYKQLVNTTCTDPLWTEFADALKAACRGRVGLPRCVVE